LFEVSAKFVVKISRDSKEKTNRAGEDMQDVVSPALAI